MRFKHKINKEVVTIKSGDSENVWYMKDGDQSKTLLLLQADVFFTQYESLTTNKKEKENA